MKQKSLNVFFAINKIRKIKLLKDRQKSIKGICKVYGVKETHVRMVMGEPYDRRKINKIYIKYNQNEK